MTAMRRRLMLFGFAAALAGDFFMAGPGRSFACGVAAFSAAQILWMSANVRGSRPAWRGCAALALPTASLLVWRVWPEVSASRFALMAAYAALSLAALAVAAGTRRVWFLAGIALLFASDLCIALRTAHVPVWRHAVGPLYLAALAALAVSTVLDSREPSLADEDSGRRRRDVAVAGIAAGILFAAAMVSFPGCYNPFTMMLSRTGRTVVGGISYPFCHYMFTFGMAMAATAVWRALPGWGGRTAAAGLLAIAAVPENVSQTGHDFGCWVATVGGAVAVFARAKDRFGRISMSVLFSVAGVFVLCVALHALRAIPFAPAVPTMQKAVIIAFAVWTFVASDLRHNLPKTSRQK